MENEGASPQGATQIEIVTPQAGGDGPISARDAARSVNDWRNKRNAEETAGAADGATQETRSDPQGDGTARSEVTANGETQGVDPATVQPITPPRSWSKDAHERWAKLDPDTQKFLLERDSQDTAAVRKAQNDAAEQRKALDADRGKVEQARQHYEAALPMLMQTLMQQQAGEFADIKTMDDVTKMAREDWPRYVLWDATQKKIAAVQQQVQQADQRQKSESQQKWATFAKEQDSLLVEKAPEFADPKATAKVQESALAYLTNDLGFKPEEIGAAWDGNGNISLRDHRMQLLIRDGLRYREAQAKLKTAPVKVVPQVLRPGPAQPHGADDAARVKALDERLSSSGSVKDAARFLAAKRAAR